MSQLTLLEQYYKIWKKNQYELKKYMMDLEANNQDLEDRVSKLEAQIQDLIIKINEYKITNNVEDNWMKIKSFAINNNISSLLNPSKIYNFHIMEISEDYIRVDKLGSKKLDKELFISVIKMLQENKRWVKIGASVKNTKPDTLEGFIKTNFYKGEMNGNMTAPWVSAILVRANLGVIFNNKSKGQAIKYAG